MFVSLLGELGPVELRRRWETARQLIHDNGVTYNVYGDPAGMDRPWNLDAVPVLYGQAEWAGLEGALEQRARLLDLVLADLYGPQRLLGEGVLPAELVFGHRGFLRPLHGLAAPFGRRLILYAADIGRGADGQLFVMNDRTQAPSGAGYALENRLVVSRALPDVFRDCGVQRLATFFRAMRETMKAIAPANKENPRIVLLTPGPLNETYFEHAYLARYLGYTLAEAGDLTVRDNHVFLKTLGGLQQVDVILRRQDDDFCDPLELRPESTLGVPGLVQALHAGRVAVANPLGSGILESPALMMFLPRLAKHVLGEELRMPSVPTYWCGDAEGQAYVLANLERMVIKPVFPGTRRDPVFGETLTREGLEEWRGRIGHCPRDFVGEEKIALSTAPVLVGKVAEPRHIVLRAHLAATGLGDGSGGYAVMPGGLTRFSASAESMVVSMQRGGGSKDTWVLSSGPVDPFSLLPQPGAAIDISRAGGDLPSRVADNLFWLGRYVERAEAMARLARGVMVRLADQSVETSPELQRLLGTLSGDATVAAGEVARPEQRLAELLVTPEYPGGLQSTLGHIYRIASLVRDRISADTWRIINRLERDFPSSTTPVVHVNEILPGLDRLILTFAAFGGLAMESMTRGYAWRFLDIGRRIERAVATMHLLQGTLVEVLEREGPLLEAVLEVADSLMTYRRRYMTTLQAAPVLDLLLADESNPRSVGFQLARLTEHVQALPQTAAKAEVGQRTPEERLLLRRLTDLRLVEMPEEAEPAEAEGRLRRGRLEDLLGVMAVDLFTLSERLSQTYLSHAIATRQLAAWTTE
jgi:uncharacterized circularly permuted ATP-grasp superfamily protein/uncharacterized alpha-E superfamily protein